MSQGKCQEVPSRSAGSFAKVSFVWFAVGLVAVVLWGIRGFDFKAGWLFAGPPIAAGLALLAEASLLRTAGRSRRRAAAETFAVFFIVMAVAMVFAFA